MKTYEELARGALARAEEEKKKRKKRNQIVISSLAVMLAVAAAVLAFRLPQLRGKTGDLETVPSGTAAPAAHSEPEGNASAPETAVSPSESAVSSTAATAEAAQEPLDGAQAETNAVTGADPAGDTFGGEPTYTGTVSEYVFTGDAVTEAEAEAYFAENLNGILTSLISSGVNARGAQIRFPGYSHMTLGQPGDVRLNYRDYQLWLDGSLLAVITLYRLDGELCATPSFGAPWFGSFAAFLRQHQGEKLLFFYNGFTELVLTPENVAYAPVTGDYEALGLDYDALFCDEIAFIP